MVEGVRGWDKRTVGYYSNYWQILVLGLEENS